MGSIVGEVRTTAPRDLVCAPIVALATSCALLAGVLALALGLGPVTAQAAVPELAPHTTPPTVAPSGVAAAPWATRIGWVTVSYAPIADAPPDNGGLPVRSYRVACSAPGHTTETDQDGTPPFLAVRLEGLTPGVTYTCAVAAGNGRGRGPASSVAVTMPGPPTVAPTNVTVIRTTGGGGLATYDPIADVAPDDGGLPIEAYVATCSAGGDRPRSAADREPPFGPIILNGLRRQIPYGCVVQAVNSLGAGPPSPAIDLPTRPLQPPGNLVASAGGEARTVILSFDPVGNAAGYEARCSAVDKPTRRIRIAGAGPITLRRLSSGAAYRCQVVAFNELGEGPWSAPSLPVIPL